MKIFTRMMLLLILNGLWMSGATAAVSDYDFSAYQKSVDTPPEPAPQPSSTPADNSTAESLSSEEVVAIVADYLQQQGQDSSMQIMQERVNNEFWYIVLLCSVALIALLMVLIFMRGRHNTAKDIVNAAGLILIIFGTIILVLVVDTTEQLTAAIGVLGAIAGYLFGTIQAEKKMEAEKSMEKPAVE